MITVNEFIQQYNNHVDWNMEIRNRMDMVSLEANPVTRDIIDGYLCSEKISIEDYVTETAELYECDKAGTYEMHIGSTYFWCNSDITKDEYVKERRDIIIRETNRRIEKIRQSLEELQGDLDSMNTLLQDIKR